jgi:thiamine biosynthesis lipoprotein
MNPIKYIIIITFASLLSISCQSGRNRGNMTYHHEFGEVFTTYFNIRYEFNRSLRKEILAEFEKFNNSLNPFRPYSIISKVNRNEPIKLDSFFVNVFQRAMEISAITDGAFDITVSPLVNAWGFGFDNIEEVTTEVIDSLREFVGFEKIRINADGYIEKDDPRVQLNMSAIAKGYATDVIANLLRRYGVENFLVDIGGEVVAQGKNQRGICWRIEIPQPTFGLIHKRQTVLSICNKAMATSANNRNFRIIDGQKKGHTIDPRTGFPTQQDILSATVLAHDCMTADAFATAFMVLGMEESRELARTIPGLYYYFIYALPDGSGFGAVFSEGFEQFFAD